MTIAAPGRRPPPAPSAPPPGPPGPRRPPSLKACTRSPAAGPRRRSPRGRWRTARRRPRQAPALAHVDRGRQRRSAGTAARPGAAARPGRPDTPAPGRRQTAQHRRRRRSSGCTDRCSPERAGHGSVTERAGSVADRAMRAAISGRRAPARAGSLTGRKREPGPDRGTMQEARVEARGELADQPLELDRRPPVHLLATVKYVHGMSSACRAAASTRSVLVLNTGTVERVEADRQPELLEDHRPPVPAHRDAAGVAAPWPPPRPSAGRTESMCQPRSSGIDTGAQVVQVGDPHVAPAARQEALQEAASGEGVGQVAVAGRIDARRPIRVAEEAALRRQAKRRVLLEDRRRRRRLRLAPAPPGRPRRWRALVITQSGSGAPATLDQWARSASRRSRKVRPSSASTSAFTTPPMRVAMPPANTTRASSPAASARRPSPASALGLLRPGRRRGSPRRPDAGGSTTPVTRFRSPPAVDPAAQRSSRCGSKPAAVSRAVSAGSSPASSSASSRSAKPVGRPVHAVLGHDRAMISSAGVTSKAGL